MSLTFLNAPILLPIAFILLLGCIFITFSVSSFYHGRAVAINTQCYPRLPCLCVLNADSVCVWSQVQGTGSQGQPVSDQHILPTARPHHLL